MDRWFQSKGEWLPVEIIEEDLQNDKVIIRVANHFFASRPKPKNDADRAGNHDDDEDDEDYLQEYAVGDAGKEFTVSNSEVLQREQWIAPPDDLVQLIHLHEPGILQALADRFRRRENIYTWVSSACLIAVNPFEALNLYKGDILNRYKANAKKKTTITADVNDEDLPPHVYVSVLLIFKKFPLCFNFAFDMILLIFVAQ